MRWLTGTLGPETRPKFAYLSELNSCLECDHPWRTVSAQSHAQQSSRRRDCAFERAKLRRNRFARHACLHIAGQCKVRMVEGVEHLHVKTQSRPFKQPKLPRHIDVRIREVRSARRVAP